VKNANSSTGDPFADEVEVDFDMLRALVLDGVGGEVDGADVVAEDQGARGQRAVELMEQLTEPNRLSHAVGHDAILGLGARARDNWLALRRPGDEVVAEEHDVSSVAEDRRRRSPKSRVPRKYCRIRFIAVRCGSRVSCIWRHTCWTA
jgi:hypothetical protein